MHQGGQAPPLTGPSTFAQSVTVTATPDLITQDGQSQSAINVRVFDANGQPMSAVPLRIDMLVNGTLVDYGTLSTKSIVTGTDGRATTVYTAPPAPPPTAQVSSTVTIRATAIGTDTPSSAPFSAEIRLVPPGVILPPAETPTPEFTVTPTPVNLNVAATFDASTSCGGAVTGGACSGSSPITSYAWTFGDGSSGSRQDGLAHVRDNRHLQRDADGHATTRGVAASKTQTYYGWRDRCADRVVRLLSDRAARRSAGGFQRRRLARRRRADDRELQPGASATAIPPSGPGPHMPSLRRAPTTSS